MEDSIPYNSLPPNTNSFALVKLIRQKKRKKLSNDLLIFFSRRVLLSSLMRWILLVSWLLCNALWYIDGHHHIFQERATCIPTVFRHFSVYNNPHLLKQLTSNISAEQLHEFALDITIMLNSNFFDRPEWINIRGELVFLSERLSAMQGI